MVNNAIMAPSLHVRRCPCQCACLTVLLWYLVHALRFLWRTCLTALLCLTGVLVSLACLSYWRACLTALLFVVRSTVVRSTGVRSTVVRGPCLSYCFTGILSGVFVDLVLLSHWGT